MKRPFTLWLLLLFLAFGSLYGSVAMLLDPSGRSLEMDAVLPLLLVTDYRLPGLFLLVVMGLGPIGLSYGLLTRRRWGWTGALGVVLIVTNKSEKPQSLLDSQVGKGGLHNIVAAVQSYVQSLDIVGTQSPVLTLSISAA